MNKFKVAAFRSSDGSIHLLNLRGDVCDIEFSNSMIKYGIQAEIVNGRRELTNEIIKKAEGMLEEFEGNQKRRIKSALENDGFKDGFKSELIELIHEEFEKTKRVIELK